MKLEQIEGEIHNWHTNEATGDRMGSMFFDSLSSKDTGLLSRHADEEINAVIDAS